MKCLHGGLVWGGHRADSRLLVTSEPVAGGASASRKQVPLCWGPGSLKPWEAKLGGKGPTAPPSSAHLTALHPRGPGACSPCICFTGLGHFMAKVQVRPSRLSSWACVSAARPDPQGRWGRKISPKARFLPSGSFSVFVFHFQNIYFLKIWFYKINSKEFPLPWCKLTQLCTVSNLARELSPKRVPTLPPFLPQTHLACWPEAGPQVPTRASPRTGNPISPRSCWSPRPHPTAASLFY